MTWLRIPISALMAGVVVIAADAAIIRAFFNSKDVAQSTLVMGMNRFTLVMGMNRFEFALGVFPLASLLIFVALVRIPEILRRGASAPFFFGFETFGWAAIFLFVTTHTLAPSDLELYLRHGLEWLEHGFRSLPAIAPAILDRLPDWFQEIFDCGFVVVVLGLPELSFALLGGWLTRRAGISIQIELRRTVGVPPGPVELFSDPPPLNA